MKKENFVKVQIEIFALCENDIIVTSGIGLPDISWGEDEGNDEG